MRFLLKTRRHLLKRASLLKELTDCLSLHMSAIYQCGIVTAMHRVPHVVLYLWNLMTCNRTVTHSGMLVPSDNGLLALSAVRLVITQKTVGTILLIPTLPAGAVCALVVDSRVVAFVAVRHHSAAMAPCIMLRRILKRVRSLMRICTTLTPTTPKTHPNHHQQKTEKRGCTPRPKNCKSNT